MIHLLKEYFMPGLVKVLSFRTIKLVAGLMKIDFGGQRRFCLISRSSRTLDFHVFGEEC